jgi:prevent-host-death family protein
LLFKFTLITINLTAKESHMQATAKDLRFNSKELMDAVKRGEEVVISFRGKPCAKLVPYQETSGHAEKKELFGMWQDNDATQNVDDYVRDLRKGRF